MKNKKNNIIFYTDIISYNRILSSTSKSTKDDISHEMKDIFYLTENTNEFADANNNSNNISTFLNFLFLSNNNDEDMIGKIGLNLNIYKDSKCPSFIFSLKNQNILTKNIWVFDFYSRFDGIFILGPKPHLYNVKNNMNKEYQYVKMNIDLSEKGEIKWNLLFDKIMIKNKTNSFNFYLQNKLSNIDFNLGLIIGTYEYQQIIEQNYFNYLIDKNICQKVLIQNSKGKYFVYSCNINIYQRIRNNSPSSYFDIIPEFEFYHKNLEHSIKIFKHELFQEINGELYFNIIFEADTENNIWKLGQPFLKKHQFVFDFDSRTIGYYDINIYHKIDIPKLKDIEEIKLNNTNGKKNEKDKNIKKDKFNFNSKKFIKYFIEIIIIGIIAIFSFYIGMKIKESRKKRANELKDDDFEYLSHNNNINNINKVSQHIELNKIGI